MRDSILPTDVSYVAIPMKAWGAAEKIIGNYTLARRSRATYWRKQDIVYMSATRLVCLKERHDTHELENTRRIEGNPI